MVVLGKNWENLKNCRCPGGSARSAFCWLFGLVWCEFRDPRCNVHVLWGGGAMVMFCFRPWYKDVMCCLVSILWRGRPQKNDISWCWSPYNYCVIGIVCDGKVSRSVLFSVFLIACSRDPIWDRQKTFSCKTVRAQSSAWMIRLRPTVFYLGCYLPSNWMSRWWFFRLATDQRRSSWRRLRKAPGKTTFGAKGSCHQKEGGVGGWV